LSNLKNVKSILCFVILFTLTSCVFSQTPKRSNEEKIKQAGEAGDKFVKRFRETLDFGIVFDEMASKIAIKDYQMGKSNDGRVDLKFFEKQDAKMKERLFKAEMNYLYLLFEYFFTFSKNIGEKNESLKIPKGYKKLVEKFRFVNGLSEGRNPRGKFPIANDEDLATYLDELETFSHFLKQQLPRKYHRVSNSN
jgi:hypothetical protein